MSASLFHMHRWAHHYYRFATVVTALQHQRHPQVRASLAGEDVVHDENAVCRRGLTTTSPHPLSAQEQRASIEGTIRDSSGGVLPGVTVEARSPSLAGVESTVTDSAGTYRFPALRPGRYEVTRDAAGIRAGRSRLMSGSSSVRFSKSTSPCRSAACPRRSRSRGESPLIDVKQNTAGANVQAETIERIPERPRLRRARDVGARDHERGAETAASRSTARAAPTTAS